MRSKDHSLRIIDLWTFRSTKSNKRYIVEVEEFENEFYGIIFLADSNKKIMMNQWVRIPVELQKVMHTRSGDFANNTPFWLKNAHPENST